MNVISRRIRSNRIVEPRNGRRVKKWFHGQNVKDLEEVFRRNIQRAYEPILDRAGHPWPDELVVLPSSA